MEIFTSIALLGECPSKEIEEPNKEEEEYYTDAFKLQEV